MRTPKRVRIQIEPMDSPLTITEAQVQRAQRIHNLRCTHTLSSRHVHEMLTAALDAAYTPDDQPQRPVCP